MPDKLVKNFIAGGDIPARRAVKMSDDNTVVVAAAATDKPIGVSAEVAATSGGRCDVIIAGVAEIVAGGNVTRGHPVVSDAEGKGINGTVLGAITGSNGFTTTQITGLGAQTQLGQFLQSGADEDIVLVNVGPGGPI